MAGEFILEVVTPERLVFSDSVESVTLPHQDGEIGILVGHIPLLGLLRCGELNYTRKGKKTFYAIGGGYVEVTGSKVNVLVDYAEVAADIDREEVERQLEEERKKLAGLTENDEDYEKVKQTVDGLASRMRVAEKARMQ